MTPMTDHEQDLWTGCPIVGCYIELPHQHCARGEYGVNLIHFTPEVKIKLDATIPKGEIRMEDKTVNDVYIEELVERLIPNDKFLLVVPDHLKAEVEALMADYRRITEIDAEAKEVHDRICGPGMHVHEALHPLGDLYYGVRDDIALKLGNLILGENDE